jgi:hypothetical protein
VSDFTQDDCYALRGIVAEGAPDAAIVAVATADQHLAFALLPLLGNWIPARRGAAVDAAVTIKGG